MMMRCRKAFVDTHESNDTRDILAQIWDLSQGHLVLHLRTSKIAPLFFGLKLIDRGIQKWKCI